LQDHGRAAIRVKPRTSTCCCSRIGAHDYRGRRKWLSEINFRDAGYRQQSSESAIYGVVWSRHIHLLPAVEVELTFAPCSWAKTDPVDEGTQGVVKDAFRIIFDRDGILARLVAAVASG